MGSVCKTESWVGGMFFYWGGISAEFVDAAGLQSVLNLSLISVVKKRIEEWILLFEYCGGRGTLAVATIIVGSFPG